MPLASLLKEYDLGLDITSLMMAAFDRAWQTIIASNSPLGEDGNAAAARLLLAKWIIAETQAGERNPKRLVEGAVEYMATLKLPLSGP